MIETWIDKLADVWETVDAPGFGKVRSFRIISRSEFPESINPSSDFPLALSIPSSVELEYSVGGPKIARWAGVTEFHLTPDLSKAKLPMILPMFGKIWAAAAANMKLSGSVNLFIIPQRADSILGPVEIQYGNESPHWGLLVNWQVEEFVNITASQ